MANILDGYSFFFGFGRNWIPLSFSYDFDAHRLLVSLTAQTEKSGSVDL